jgi:hypothetical protein
MYPRNAGSPDRISIGAVVQISDGAVQTAGVTVRVLPFGGTEADGVGTVAYSTDGVVVYTPTQGETNYTSFVLIAKKTGCIPASVTVVTSESTVSGRVYVATNGDKTGYTATVSDKTGFSLLAGTGLGAQSGSVALVTKVDELGASALTANGAVDAIPTAVWNALTTTTWVADSFGKHILISNNNNRSVQVTGGGSGHIAADIHALQAGVITSAAFSANWFTAAGLAADAVGEISDGVWDEATSGHTTAGTTGKALIDSGAAGNPWATDLATGYSGTEAGNILNQVKSQADLITSGGTVYVASPVTATGQLASPLIIGDDYLAANGRRFRWTVALPSGYVIGTSTARFGMRYEDDEGVNEFIATGTVTDATGGNVHLDFDVAKTVTGTLRPGWYQWSVEIVSATGTEITRVKSGKNVEWQEKQT